MSSYDEPTRPLEFLISEAPGQLSREKVTLAASQGALVAGTVLAKNNDGAASAVGANDVPAPAGATITASPTVTKDAKPGVHRFVCITAGATGKFRHYDPDGEVVGDATTGTEYTGGGLTLTITDSGTDPAVGEAFKVTVTIAAGTGYYYPLDEDAVDGKEVADAILCYDTANSASAQEVTVIERLAEVKSSLLEWGDNDPDDGAAALLLKNIKVRA